MKPMNYLLFIACLGTFAIGLTGCEDPGGYRNSPHEQVVDYNTCRDGGMRAYLNGYAEVLCAPPEASVKP